MALVVMNVSVLESELAVTSILAQMRFGLSVVLLGLVDFRVVLSRHRYCEATA